MKMKELTLAKVKETTEFNNAMIQDLLNHASRIDDDSNRKDRIASCKCKWCFYGSTLSGQAFTSYDCLKCKIGFTHPNTARPVLCLPCAKEVRLCVACGGDIEGKNRKKL